MKTLIVAAAVLAMGGTAFAGEGNGNPFPYQAPSRTYNMQAEGWKQASPATDNPYPFAVPGRASAAEEMYRPAGSQGEPQAASSMPPAADVDLPQAPAMRSPVVGVTHTAAMPSATQHN